MLESKHVRENPKGSNRGDSIDIWRENYGFKKPVPWCGIFVGEKSFQGKVKAPKIRSALSFDYATKKSKKLSDIIYGAYHPKPGDYIIKRRKGGGHVDCILEWNIDKKKGKVIGGNVDDKVKIRDISLQKMIANRTTHITPVYGKYERKIK